MWCRKCSIAGISPWAKQNSILACTGADHVRGIIRTSDGTGLRSTPGSARRDPAWTPDVAHGGRGSRNADDHHAHGSFAALAARHVDVGHATAARSQPRTAPG